MNMRMTFKACGNWGTLTCDALSGNVVEYKPETDVDPAHGYQDILRLDVNEWRRKYPDQVLEGSEHDILDFGNWDKFRNYEGPDHHWRCNRGRR